MLNPTAKVNQMQSEKISMDITNQDSSIYLSKLLGDKLFDDAIYQYLKNNNKFSL